MEFLEKNSSNQQSVILHYPNLKMPVLSHIRLLRVSLKYILTKKSLQIIRCDNCGSSAVHIFCGKLMRKAPYFICENHENAIEEMEKRNSEIKMRLKEENISEDDDGWIDDSHLIKTGFEPMTSKKRESTSPPPKPGLVKIKKPKLTPKRSPENTP